MSRTFFYQIKISNSKSPGWMDGCTIVPSGGEHRTLAVPLRFQLSAQEPQMMRQKIQRPHHIAKFFCKFLWTNGTRVSRRGSRGGSHLQNSLHNCCMYIRTGPDGTTRGSVSPPCFENQVCVLDAGTIWFCQISEPFDIFPFLFWRFLPSNCPAVSSVAWAFVSPLK